MNLQLWALFALVGCACARTAQRQQSVSAHITSLTDKDARQKASTHTAFANAGRQAGIELWRIENFDPVPVKASDHGKFYKGDSYVVLKTTSDKRNNLSWDIHYWIGSESTQDEAGAAAILTVGLDDKFGGAAVQHRETLGHESAQFIGYFKPAIRYLDGGVASGFSHVTTNAGAEKRFFQIKGKRNVRVRQVDPLIASMNKGDCFILDVDHDVYVYVGDKAKNIERLKAISVANQVRDQDHNGRAKVEIIDQYSSETDVQKFFTALGSGSRDLVPEESAGGDDQTFEKGEESAIVLSEISDSSGKLKITPLSKPFKQEQLKPQECYILDTVSGSIYVWVGKQSTDKEKAEAMSKAQQYLSAKNYPAWVHIARIPQGTEPAVFKQYFQTWRDVGMSHSRLVRSAIQKPNASLFEAKFTKNHKVYFEEVEKFEQSDLNPNDVKVLDAGNEVFVWIGTNTSYRQRKSANAIADAYISHFNRNPTPVVVMVKQGREPGRFQDLFRQWDEDMIRNSERGSDENDSRMLSNEI